MKEENPFFLPGRRRRIDSGFEEGGGARYVYDPEYAAIVDAVMHVEDDDGTRLLSI